MAKFFNVDVVSFNAVLFAIAAVYAPIACAQECTLPRAQHITWDKMGGYWYEIGKDETALSSGLGQMVFSDINAVPGGIELKINDQSIKDGKKAVPYHWVWGGDETYKDDPNDAQSFLKQWKADNPKDDFVTVVKEIKSMGAEAFFTDYDNYFIIAVCGGEGESYLYLMHRNPNPSAADIMQMWRKIIEIGGEWKSIPLYPVDKLTGSAGGSPKE